MKHYLLLALLFAFRSKAQTNEMFPAHWTGPDPIPGITTIHKTEGFINDGIHLQTIIAGHDTISGSISSSSADPFNGKGGVPYHQKPFSINGYYRYRLSEKDTALLLVIFKKNGHILSKDLFKIRGTGEQPFFHSFSYPLSLSSQPDTVIVAAYSSCVTSKGVMSAGSFLELDQLMFDGIKIDQQLPNGSFDDWIDRKSVV